MARILFFFVILVEKMNCEECIKEKGYVICKECDEVLCQDCDKSLHKGGTRKFHSRPLICSSCKSSAILECKLCCIFSCESCKKSHTDHKTTPIMVSKTLGVFWDISNFSSLTKPINDVIKEISQRIAVPKFVKLYTDL